MTFDFGKKYGDSNTFQATFTPFYSFLEDAFTVSATPLPAPADGCKVISYAYLTLWKYARSSLKTAYGGTKILLLERLTDVVRLSLGREPTVT